MREKREVKGSRGEDLLVSQKACGYYSEEKENLKRVESEVQMPPRTGRKKGKKHQRK